MPMSNLNSIILSDQIIFEIPKPIKSFAKENFDLFVNTAKSYHPYSDNHWNDSVWDITKQEKKSASFKRTNYRLHYALTHARMGKKGDAIPFDPIFADLIKSMHVIRYIEKGIGIGPQHTLLTAARYLYQALGTTWSGDFSALNLDNFSKAAELMMAREGESTCYRIGKSLERISSLLNRFMITPVAIDFKSPLKRTKAHDPLSERMIERTSKLQLKDGVIEAILFLDREVNNDVDRLTVEIMKLFMFTGFRFSELITLEYDSLLLKEENGEIFTGIRYYPAKGGHRETRVKWFSDLSGRLVKECFSRVVNLTRAPRQVAKWLIENKGKTYLRNLLNTRANIQLSTFRDVVGLSNVSGAYTYLDKRNINQPRTIDKFDKAFCLKDDERCIFQDNKTGFKVEIDKALFVVFQDFYSKKKVTKEFLVKPLSEGEIQTEFNGKPGKYRTLSIFERYGLLDREGKPLKLTSHMFRRFLTTLYNEGGVPITVLTKMFGRSNKNDTLEYLYTTPKRRTEEVREIFKKGDILGPKADIAKQIPISERNEFIDTVVESVHHLGFGFCSHDWSTLPCEKQLQCLDNCMDFHIKKSDPKAKAYLLQQKKWAERSLSSALQEKDDETYGVDNHIHHYERILTTVDKFLTEMGEEV